MYPLAFTLTALGLLAFAFIPLTLVADAIHAHTLGGDQ